MGSNDKELFAEWAKQTFSLVEKTLEEVHKCREDSARSGEKVNERLRAIEVRLAVIVGVTIAVVTIIEVLAKVIK